MSAIPAHKRGGRTSSRARAGLRWTRAALKAGSCVQGEMNLVSMARTASTDGAEALRSLLGEAGSARVRRNRVVLAVVATVKPLRRRHCVNRRGAVNFAEVTEARRNSSPGRARHRPSNHRAGKAWSRLPCVSPVHCVCNHFAWGSLWVPAGARSSLHPFFRGGEARSIARAKHAARLRARVCASHAN